MTQPFHKLNTRITHRTNNLVIAATDNLEGDHNVAFVWRALNRPNREMLTSIMNVVEVKIAFQDAIVLMATGLTVVQAIA